MALSLTEFIKERRLLSRGVVLLAGLIGALFGAILMFFFVLLGLVV